MFAVKIANPDMNPKRLVRSWDARKNPSSRREQPFFDEAADDVAAGDVDLMDERRRIRWGMQAEIAARGHFAARSAGETDEVEAPLAGGARSP